MVTSFPVITPFLPHFPDGTVYGLGEGALGTFGTGEAALGGTPELTDGTMQVLRFLQHIFGFEQNWTGGIGNAARLWA